MRLRLRFSLMLGLSTALTAAVGLFAIQETRRLDALSQAAIRGQDAQADARALLVHTYEFALYGQPRAAQQWRARHAALESAFGSSDAMLGEAQPPDLGDELRSLPALFERLVAARTQDAPAALGARRSELLTDNLIAGTQVILDETRAWVVHLSAQRTLSERRLAAVAVAALLLLVALIAWTARDLSVRVMAPFHRLQRVMNDVANGDLTARSALRSADEIGDLSAAFDVMTSALQVALAQRVASEQQLRLIAENLPVRVARFDREGRFLFANAATWRMYRVDSEAELLGRSLRELRGEAGWAELRLHIEAVLNGQPQTFVVDESGVAGTPRWSAVSLVPDLDGEGEVQGWYAMIQDITETTLNRRRIEQSLAEKDMLLREVHHRVKNNLQVVTSLLSLQSRQAAEPSVQAMFDESRDRIRSMALIHEKLYRSEAFSAVDFGDYLRSLVAMIAASQHRADVVTELRLEPLRLDIDRAVPAALVVNELVTNCFKHAFPPGHGGRINVWFGSVGDDRLRLRVSDNGVGAVAVDVQHATSLGLRLVRLLAAQIDATMSARVEHGFETTLEFPAVRRTAEEIVNA